MSYEAQGQEISVLSTPPFLPGLPVIGHALQFRRDPVALFRRGYDELGPIFGLRLGPQRAVVLLGPEANRFFFTETDRLLSMREVYRFLAPMFGEDFFFLGPEEQYQDQRSILLPAFAGHRVDGYVSAMVREVTDWLDSLEDAGEFEMTEALGTLTMLIATRSFLGDAFRSRAAAEFWRLFRDFAGGIEYVLPPHLPLPRFVKRDRARDQLHRLVSEILDERRAARGSYDDFLQTLLDARTSSGEPIPDPLLISIILGFMFAGHETTQGHTCWALIQLLQHPDYLEKVLDEQRAVLADSDGIDAAACHRLSHLDWAIKETERMLPTVRVIMRYAADTFELGGFEVPKGWLVIASPAVSQRLPEVFANPDDYDPERFSPDRAEDRGTPYSLIGFGGGLHRCIGMYFASTEMKVILSMLLGRLELELATPNPRAIGGPGTSRPVAPCIARYRRRFQLGADVRVA